jgi:class 3 adenylate cyclase
MVMAWNEERSRRRVAAHDSSTFVVRVSDLCRDMDFENLGSQDVKRVHGAHIYADVPNFHLAVEDAGGNKEEQKKLLRAASVLRRVQDQLLGENDVKAIQYQAARLHCLNYKPYNSEEEESNENRRAERAKRSVIMAITLNSYLFDVFNGVFKEVRKFQSAVGISSGVSYVGNIGLHGERERIGLGSCANLGAKVLGGHDTITITSDVYEILPDDLKELFSKCGQIAGVGTYQAKGVRWSKYPELMDDLGVKFDEEALKQATEGHKDDLPLAEMDVIEPTTLINPTLLTEGNNRRTQAVAIFADIDGFTKHVQEAEKNEDVESLVRQLRMVRQEFHKVISDDYEGLVIQHQGDRVLALVHTPTGGDGHQKRCEIAVDVAIGIQSSMDHVLNKRLGDGQKNLRVAIGLDVGKALVTRLGKRGEKTVVFLGPEVESAEDLQLRSKGQEIRIGQAVYNALPEGSTKCGFSEDGKGAYVAFKLTFPELDRLEEEDAARANRMGVTVSDGQFSILTAKSFESRPLGDSKPWSSGHSS